MEVEMSMVFSAMRDVSQRPIMRRDEHAALTCRLMFVDGGRMGPVIGDIGQKGISELGLSSPFWPPIRCHTHTHTSHPLNNAAGRILGACCFIVTLVTLV